MFLKSNVNMKSLNSSLVKASDMVQEVCAGPIYPEQFLAIFLSNSGVNYWYKFSKNSENMKSLNRSLVKASDIMPEVCVVSIYSELFLAIFLSNSGVN